MKYLRNDRMNYNGGFELCEVELLNGTRKFQRRSVMGYHSSQRVKSYRLDAEIWRWGHHLASIYQLTWFNIPVGPKLLCRLSENLKVNMKYSAGMFGFLA